jgi:hypothetical protein
MFTWFLFEAHMNENPKTLVKKYEILFAQSLFRQRQKKKITMKEENKHTVKTMGTRIKPVGN